MSLLRTSRAAAASASLLPTFIGGHHTPAGGVVLAAKARLSTSTDVTSSSSNSARNCKPDELKYFNFGTRDKFLRRYGGLGSSSRGGGRRRSRAMGVAEEEQIARVNSPFRDVACGEDTPPIFRKEGAGAATPSGRLIAQTPTSVDVSAKRFLDMFCNYDSKRCKLCSEPFVQWHLHSCGIPHNGREGILLELVRPFCGLPEEQVQRWTRRLVFNTDYGRIPALSHVDSQTRKRRLQYLLRYLKDRKVLAEVFNVSSTHAEAARSFEFERLEFIGDGVVKYVLSNIMNIIFPVSEGGTRGRLTNFQFVMDGNEGLARGYDFLELQDFTQSSRVVSKFKSDVVETLFGELQFYIWATELDLDTQKVSFPFTKENYTLRAIVQHVMYELATVLFLYHVEYILGTLQRVVREEQLHFIKSDPSLLHMQCRNGGETPFRQTRRFLLDTDDEGSLGDDAYYGGGGGGGVGVGGKLVIPAPTRKLMPVRVARAHLQGGSAATYLEATNYDNYKRVVPLGGLLPRPFARGQLAVIPNYMPHIQRDEAMTQQLRQTSEVWKTQLDEELSEVAKRKPFDSTAGDEAASAADAVWPEACRLGPTPTVPRRTTKQEPLSVPRLKDEQLIEELI
jgi:hypothetical protein